MKSCRPPHTVKNSAESLLVVAAKGRSSISTDDLGPNEPVYSYRIIWDCVGSHRCLEVGGGSLGLGAEMFGVLSQVFRVKHNLYVPSVQQKSSGLKLSKSRTGSHVTYSYHHNSSRFTFPIFAHSWRFSVFHSLQSITPRIYQPKTSIHLLNLKLKHE